MQEPYCYLSTLVVRVTIVSQLMFKMYIKLILQASS